MSSQGEYSNQTLQLASQSCHDRLPATVESDYLTDDNRQVIYLPKGIICYQQEFTFRYPQKTRLLRLGWVVLGLAVIAALSALAGSLITNKNINARSNEAFETLAMKVIKDQDYRLSKMHDESSEPVGRAATLSGPASSLSIDAIERLSRRIDYTLEKLNRPGAAQTTPSERETTESKPPMSNQSLRSPLATSGINSMSAPVNEYNFDKTIPVIEGAVVHRNSETGEADYWLVVRQGEAGPLVRVIPFAMTGIGPAVHSLADGHDYIITASGWKKYGL